MEFQKKGYIYILTNKSNSVLYTGITSDLRKRITQHKQKLLYGFTNKYNLNKLVYFETFDSITDAISREKQIKKRSRKYKIELIESVNNRWNDLIL